MFGIKLTSVHPDTALVKRRTRLRVKTSSTEELITSPKWAGTRTHHAVKTQQRLPPSIKLLLQHRTTLTRNFKSKLYLTIRITSFLPDSINAEYGAI
jgi:hypothetical protein